MISEFQAGEMEVEYFEECPAEISIPDEVLAIQWREGSKRNF
jgi:hypothetical protein